MPLIFLFLYGRAHMQKERDCNVNDLRDSLFFIGPHQRMR